MLSSDIICLNCSPAAQHKHNHHHLTSSLENTTLLYQTYTKDWDSSTTDNQAEPQTTSRHAFIKIMIGFTLER